MDEQPPSKKLSSGINNAARLLAEARTGWLVEMQALLTSCADEIDSLQQRLSGREEAIDSWKKLLGITDADATITVGSEIERLQRENAELMRRNVVLSTAYEPPKPAHLREPPHCCTCSCGPTQPPVADDARLESLEAPQLREIIKLHRLRFDELREAVQIWKTAWQEATQSPSLSIESFEHWATVVGDYNFNRVSPEFGRTYNFNNTEHAWRGWANGFAVGQRVALEPPSGLPAPNVATLMSDLLDWASDAEDDETNNNGSSIVSAEGLRKLCYRAHAALSASAQPPFLDWQSIETAPRHKSILVCIDSIGGDSFEAYQNSIGTWHCMDGTNGKMTVLVVAPTHWQPLPPPYSTATKCDGQS